MQQFRIHLDYERKLAKESHGGHPPFRSEARHIQILIESHSGHLFHLIDTGVCERNHSLNANLYLATQQKKLQSSLRFGAFRADFPACLLIADTGRVSVTSAGIRSTNVSVSISITIGGSGGGGSSSSSSSSSSGSSSSSSHGGDGLNLSCVIVVSSWITSLA